MRASCLIAAVLIALAQVGSATAAEGFDPLHADQAGDPINSPDVYDPLFDGQQEGAAVELDADPFETANRGIFALNNEVDTWVLDPVTRGYQWLVPPPARHGVTRFFANLNSPVVFANQVLQLRPVPAAKTLGRFVANTSLGIVGIFDFADDVMGIPGSDADFGQTLHRYGMPRGPYLMIPLFGPTTARDAAGTVIDLALDPLTYMLGFKQWIMIMGGGQGIAVRESNVQAMHALRESSVDFYSALRSAYLQSRRVRELEVRPRSASTDEAELEAEDQPAAGLDQDFSVPAASFAMRSSIAAISASKFSRLTMPENSERRSASSLTMPSR